MNEVLHIISVADVDRNGRWSLEQAIGVFLLINENKDTCISKTNHKQSITIIGNY